MFPLTKSINTCCLVNSVAIIISIDIIVVRIFKCTEAFLHSNIYKINNILTAQCKLGKQFWAGVSTQNTILVISSIKLVPVTIGLSTQVGYTTNIILAIKVDNE